MEGLLTQLPSTKMGLILQLTRHLQIPTILQKRLPCPVDVQPVIHLYAVPMTAFTTEEDENGEGYEGEEHEFTF